MSLSLGGPRWLGPITPLGGLAFIVGWAVVRLERLAQLTQGRVYIRRQGRMTVAQARALRELLERYRIPVSTEPADWGVHFGRRAPLALEIGFGMGHALLETAQRHSEWNCVGVEVYRPGIGALLNAVEAAELANVRVIEGDARGSTRRHGHRGDAASGNGVLPRPMAEVQTSQAAIDQRRVRGVGRTPAELRTANCSSATDWEHYAEAMLRRSRC